MREPWLLIAVIWSLGTVVIWLLWGLTAATWFVAVPVLLLVLFSAISGPLLKSLDRSRRRP